MSSSAFYIFGAGVHGAIFRRCLGESGVDVLGFVVDCPLSNVKPGIPILAPSDLSRDVNILVSVGLVSRMIKARLSALGFVNVYDFTESLMLFPQLIPAMARRSMWYSDVEDDMANPLMIEDVKSLFTGRESKRLLEQIARLRLHLRAEDYVVPDESTQYFPGSPNILAGVESLRFVDGGAFTGDTVASLRKVAHSCGVPIEYIACFEPDRRNLMALNSALGAVGASRSPDKVIVFPGALWSHSSVMSFGGDGSSSSSLRGSKSSDSDCETLVPCFSLDETLCSAAPNFIKIDIEGAEQQAIIGASEIIKRYMPILAISLYHRPSDLWEIPMLINQIRPGYEMHLRVYGDMLLETVLYCVPPNPR